MTDKSILNQIEEGNLSNLTTYQAGVMQAASHRLLQKHCDDILKKYGITKTQWLIIGTIRDAGSKGMRITELSEEVGTTLSYLTNTINLLELKNILQRITNTEDSRSKFVSINLAFEAKCDEIETYLRDELRSSIYSNVAPDEFRTYMKVLYQLSKV